MALLDTAWEPRRRRAPGTSPRLLHRFFEAQVEKRPNHTAVEFADESLTYKELDQQANRIANTLAARGVKPGDLVALYLKKSPRLYAAMLGILKAGAGYVPIDPRFPLERIRAILDDSRAKSIITEHPLAGEIDGHIGTPILRLDLNRDEIARQSPRAVAGGDKVDPQSLSYVIYTSGSTGRPKGVMIEHRNAVAFVRSLKSIYRLTADDRVYQGFSTAFDASVEEIWAAFSRGGTLVVPTEDVERSPADVAEFINEREITYYSTVPTMLSMIDRDLPTVRTLVLGGEACSSELVARWAKPGVRMINTYGPTEATVVATWADCVPGETVTIGVPLPGYATYVLDENLQPVEPGESGELFIGGLGVARGYMNQEALTAERFISNPFVANDGDRLYRTSDHVRLGDNGELYFLGRLDDQIKIRGFRVELSEIEAVLIEHPAIKAAAVRVVDIEDMKQLAAYVVCEGDGASLDRTSLAELLRARMPSYMIPQYLDVLPTLPVTTSGKIDRKALPSPQKLFADIGVVVPPADELERSVAEAWQEAFRLSQISVEADFFRDLGGHSFLAAKTVTLMRRATGATRLSVRDVYEHRTIRAVAKHIRKLNPSQTGMNPATRLATDARTLPPAELPSDVAFKSVHPVVRWTTVALQALAATLYYGIMAAPLAYTALIITAVADGHIGWTHAAWISTIVGFAAWPFLLVLSIAVKWIVVGRYIPGRYPLWSFYYLRWWIANRFQALAWAEMFKGTPLMSLYWRAMGAKIGRNVTISTPFCSAFDVISIGDNSSVGLETQLLGYRVEDGCLVIGPTTIGNDCFIGMHCAVGLGATMGDGARLDDMSLLADGTEIAAGEGRRGIPAAPAAVTVPEAKPAAQRFKTVRSLGHGLKRMLFGALHLALIYVMGYFLLATSLPAIALVLTALYFGGPTWGIIAAFASVPVWLLTYTRSAIMLKRLLGPLKAGTFSLYSVSYLRHWFSAYLLENTKNILMPVYATVYLPGLLRAFGAKIGRGVEISTVSHVCPDVLEVGEGSFLADACLVGGERIHNGKAEYGAVRIGSKTFIGNSALVSGGHTIGDGVLIGVASTPPADTANVPDNTRWLGAPGFSLPNTQKDLCFGENEIFTPTIWARMERAATDAVRILLPGLVGTACAIAFVSLLVAAFRTLPILYVIAGIPFAAMAISLASVVITAILKKVLIGAHKTVVKPLWSRFVWHNELVNGVYESVAASAMAPLMGSPMVSPCLRMMGCKVGKWCFIETTLFSEFDLVKIGDRAALNLGATIQTHLFEDRVFKADHLNIGPGCSVGNMAVVLYGTEMAPGSVLGPLSVLMKGESLPPHTRWHGIPCEPVAVPTTSAADIKAVEKRTLPEIIVVDFPTAA
ncbi:Pls/PosA family non-ribosomal peptide synthetase [Hyphomicrobium sp.]|uniref:Pls/PosA family non-ribosomal peptide synthetase n=1 Tax=Hyphomicrobium sp. TaxID=82 RepID=UPI002E361D39|nr:Pls/PosA family non-ribosomal peptide synthetase [Hyphomicrobium sp.]HEX2842309.1 Pls/PosA family non-ribosomal peptide synthetase [Hyphomicrobium sp.]